MEVDVNLHSAVAKSFIFKVTKTKSTKCQQGGVRVYTDTFFTQQSLFTHNDEQADFQTSQKHKVKIYDTLKIHNVWSYVLHDKYLNAGLRAKCCHQTV